MIAACYGARMSKTQDRMIAGFTAAQRDYIRRELDVLLDASKRGRGLSAQDLAQRSRSRQAEAAADRQGTDRAWPHAAGYRRTLATAVLHQGGPDGPAGDDDRPPPRESRKSSPISGRNSASIPFPRMTRRKTDTAAWSRPAGP